MGWRSWSRRSVARWIGLILPRVLLRLPYGSETDPIDGFAFEEMAPRRHDTYLWGNPAFAAALLIAQRGAGSQRTWFLGWRPLPNGM